MARRKHEIRHGCSPLGTNGPSECAQSAKEKTKMKASKKYVRFNVNAINDSSACAPSNKGSLSSRDASSSARGEASTARDVVHRHLCGVMNFEPSPFKLKHAKHLVVTQVVDLTQDDSDSDATTLTASTGKQSTGSAPTHVAPSVAHAQESPTDINRDVGNLQGQIENFNILLRYLKDDLEEAKEVHECFQRINNLVQTLDHQLNNIHNCHGHFLE